MLTDPINCHKSLNQTFYERLNIQNLISWAFMTSTINKIKFKLDKNKTSGCELRLLINDTDLFDLLEQYTERCPHPGQWSDKEKAAFDIDSLKKSTITAGTFPIVGSHAITHLAEDVLLKDLKIIHKDEFIYWIISPPGAGVHYETSEKIEFCFHKPQYVEEVGKLISNAKVVD